MPFEQQGRERWRQGQGVDGRDDCGNGNRERKLLVELARESADESQRHKHRNQHQCNRNDGSRHLAHGAVGCVARAQARLDVSLHVLYHHDGVVDHNADRQHQPEEAERVDGKAEQVHDRKGADHRHRNRQQGNNGSTPGLQKDDHDQHHQCNRFQQGVHHGLDGRAHELRGVVNDFVVHAFRHGFLQLAHHSLHII